MTNKDRAALHKELLAVLPLKYRPEYLGGYEEGFNRCLFEVRKAIDEVFSSKKTL